MSDKSSIEWTDATWPIVQGCDPVSQGCVNCYAVPLLWRMAHNPNPKISGPLQGVVEEHNSRGAGAILRFTGELALREDRIDWPLKWKQPRMIFVPSHGDIFHKDVPDEFLDKIFATMGACDDQGLGHQFQVLTKRGERMRDYICTRGHTAWNSRRLGPEAWPARNVWLGVSCEDQATADERIPLLLDTPAAVRFISAEPLLGPIDLTRLCVLPQKPGSVRAGIHVDALRNKHCESQITRGLGPLDWVIVGGESGPNARPMHPDWARDLRDQCAAAGVAFFFKQWGEWAPGECADFPQTRTERVAYLFNNNWDFGRLTPRVSQETHVDDGPDVWWIGKKRAGRLLDGVEHNGFPQIAKQSEAA